MKNFALALLILCIFLLAGSCKKNNPVQPVQPVQPILPPSEIRVISGDNQPGYPNRPLTDTIIIKVTPKNAADVAGYHSFFSTGSNGSVAPNISVINGNYYIKAVWTLGSSTANNR